MIKPVSNNRIGIEPIKVPHQNNVSFSGLKLNTKTAKQVTQKVLGKNAANKIAEKLTPLYKKIKPTLTSGSEKITGFIKKVPEYIRKAGTFISEKATQLKNYVVNSAKDFADATKNPAKKSRTLMKLAIALGATAGAGGVTKKAIDHNKKDSK